MSRSKESSELDLEPIEHRLLSATPGPWEVHVMDDWQATTMAVITTEPASERGYWEDIDRETVVAATLVQSGEGNLGVDNGRYAQNSTFTANCPSDIAALIQEVHRLRAQISGG